MQKYDIPTRSASENSLSKFIIPMTDDMYEVLRGAVLGDGSLIIAKNGVNASFSYTSKSYQHIHYVAKDFLEYGIKGGIRHNDIYDKRTEKTYFKYRFDTIVSPVFTEEYYKWYVDGVKHIPSDLVLTPKMCQIWYLGDGCLRNSSHNNNYQDIHLCTNCFDKTEIENILLPQLEQFEAKLYYVAKLKNGQKSYAIRIGKKSSIIDFLEYIGDCPFDDYKYKWEVKPNQLNGAQAKYNVYADAWMQEYINGASISEIAYRYKATNKAVENTLRNHSLI